MQPFSAGPRNCLGKNLAYAEMKLILARLVFEFDFELLDSKDDWADQRVFTLWEKRPLMLKIWVRSH
jgi:cytochrome P450